MYCGNEPGPGDRIVEVVDDLVDRIHEIGGIDRQLADLEPAVRRELPRVLALVVQLTGGELAGESLELRPDLGRGERCGDARVEPAGQVGADGYVGAQMEVDRLSDELAQLGREPRFGAVEVGLEVHFPVAVEAHSAIAHDQRMGRQELVDPAEERLPV